jgi:hypothetical protein
MDQLSLPNLVASFFLIIIGMIMLYVSPRQAIRYVVLVTAAIGYIRRLFMFYFAFSPLDTLVLVGFLIMLAYLVTGVLRRQLASTNTLGKLVMALGVVLFLQMFNPLQGGFLVGAYGGLVFFGLLGSYQLGRIAGDNETINKVSKTLIGIAVLAGIYGMYQTFFGFSTIEKEWIYRQKLDLALGGLRVLSFFSSFSEYVQVLGIGAVICFVKILRGKRSLLPIWIFLLGCIIASSSRGTLLTAGLTHIILWAIQGKDKRSWWPRLAILLLLFPFILINGLSLAKDSTKNTALESLVSHQEAGLSDPLNSKKSTGGDHLKLVADGFVKTLTQPLGHGTGSLTVAAGKFKSSDDETTGGSEGDISDMFIITGFVGGVIYIGIIGVTFWRLMEHWHKERHESILVTLGVLISVFGWWTANAHYMIPMVVWFLVGSVERREKLLQRSLLDKNKKRRQEITSTTLSLPTSQ